MDEIEFTSIKFFIIGAMTVYFIFYLIDIAEDFQNKIESDAFQRGYSRCMTDMTVKNDKN